MIIDEKAKHAILGMLWMLSSGLCFVTVIGIVRWLEGSLPAVEASFIRYIIGLLFFIPFFLKKPSFDLDGDILIKYIVRAIFHAFAVVFWFYAMAKIPMAEVTAIGYMTPVFVTLGGVIFFRESISYWRIAAITVAFFGVILILRPGFEVLSLGQLSQVLATICFAGSYLLVKDLTRTENSSTIVAMMTLLVTIALAPIALYVWERPSLDECISLFFVAIFATLGHFFMTKAFSLAPVIIIQPVTFLQLVWATLLGVFIFNEGLDIFVLFGGITIIISVVFISYRETVRKTK